MIRQSRFIIGMFAVAACTNLLGAQAVEQSATERPRAAALPFAQVAGLPGVAPGTFEIGIFGQFSYFGENADFPLRSRSKGGFGGRVGVFVTPAISVELDAVMTKLELESDGSDVDHSAIALRANLNSVPEALGGRASMILGVGPVRTKYSGDTASSTKWGVSGLAGLRAMISDPVGARADVVLDYIPGSGSVNLGARLGFSVLFGMRNGAVRAGVDETATAQPPVTPTRPTPPPITDDPSRIGAAALSAVEISALNEMIFFDYDRADIRADAAAILDRKIPILLARGGFQVRIEGHADDRGSDEYNLALGQRRAAEARDYLMARGVPAARLPVVSYGEEYKLCVRDPMTEECHQQNRRAEFRILGPGETDGP